MSLINFILELDRDALIMGIILGVVGTLVFLISYILIETGIRRFLWNRRMKRRALRHGRHSPQARRKPDVTEQRTATRVQTAVRPGATTTSDRRTATQQVPAQKPTPHRRSS